jgi:hypothetical protein
MEIKMVVTRERYDEVLSVEDGFFLFESTDKEVYLKMCEFVVDDKGQYVGVDAARKMFKGVPRKELATYILDFLKAIGEAFVPPTSGAASDGP